MSFLSDARSRHVETHVIELEERPAFRLAHRHDLVEISLPKSVVGKTREVMAQDDRADELAERRRVLERRRSFFEIARDIREAGPTQSLRRGIRPLEVPGGLEADEPLRERLTAKDVLGVRMEPFEIPDSAALSDEAPTTAEGSVNALEQPIVIVQPVERRGAEDGICRRVRDVRREVCADELDAIAERRKPPARFLDHVRGAVDRDDATARQSLREHAREPSAAAARIDDGLTTFEWKAVEHAEPPVELRVGDTLVSLGIPFVRRAHGRENTLRRGTWQQLARGLELTVEPDFFCALTNERHSVGVEPERT